MLDPGKEELFDVSTFEAGVRGREERGAKWERRRSLAREFHTVAGLLPQPVDVAITLWRYKMSFQREPSYQVVYIILQTL